MLGNKRKDNMSYKTLHLIVKLHLLTYFFNTTAICNLRFTQWAKLLEPRSFSNIRRELFLERNTGPRKRDGPKKDGGLCTSQRFVKHCQ